MQLVILAAGHGRRFGGLKQLAPVGPNGEAIMDYTALAAEACGFTGIVVVVRDEIRDEVAAHVATRWDVGLPVELVCQPPVPGTAQAVLCARALVDGPFAVANADDLYGEAALRLISEHFGFAACDPSGTGDRDRHVLVAYRLERTVITAATVTRGLCEVGADHELDRVAEHRVHRRADGRFDAVPLVHVVSADAPLDGHPMHRILSGGEPVSMNLWGFHPRLFDELDVAVRAFDPGAGSPPELLLPEVVGSLVSTGADEVHVVETDNRCIGITHREDIAIVHDEVLHESLHLDTVRAARPELPG
ncbi:MAG: NTP transferase domain-containing protein [Actinomycetota bacterium]|nr:NTP transferase domain-containing protein [Actinomycetota bacterium]